ncbi:hypothetical protein ACJD0Z_06975 [Flavobacteriaceae bacterium M23B6Z8]
MLKKIIPFIFFSTFMYAQNINFDRLGQDKLFRVTGGLSTNGVYYEGTANRDPFTYFVSGNLNFSVAGLYSIPLSFTYSNQEFDFSNPFKFNRLSLHPSYKWVTAHIGDVAMTFSPYTVNGHQFTGAGVDLAPEGRFKFSALYGRFLRAAEYDAEEPASIPAYKRTGFGFNTSYEFDFAKIGLILFRARDDENSIETPFPSDLNLAPKENVVLSTQANFRLFDKLQFSLEYAVSGVTEDTRATEDAEKSGLTSFLLDANITTDYYTALRADLSYPAGNGAIGVGYERIDPDYKTFGAYFFNNDLENITINASQTIFDNKLNVSMNAGLQRDNLDNSKSSELQRIVSAVNLSYTASDKLSLNASYSNFQSYTNIRDQFDFINQVADFDNIDTLNYRQISQNANLGVNYAINKSEKKVQSVNLNLTYQSTNNQQDGETIESGLSNFYNVASAYTVGFPQRAMTVSLAANVSYNTIEPDKNLTAGPTVAVTKSFLDKKLRTNFSSSYNTAFNNGLKQTDIYNFRLSGNYNFLESHNLSVNLLSLFRSTATSGSNSDFTATLAYSYVFDSFRLKFKKRTRLPNDNELRKQLPTVQFRYRSVTYSGTFVQVNQQLNDVRISSKFENIPLNKQDELSVLYADVTAQKKPGNYKEKALAFLEALYSFDDFLKTYDQMVYNVIERIKDDMADIDFVLEKRFLETKFALDELRKNADGKAKEIEEQQNELKNRQEKLVGHRWMEKRFEEYTSVNAVENPDKFLKEFKETEAANTYRKYEKESDVKKIELYLESQIIDFYYNKSLKETDPEDFDLKYIEKKEN